MDEPQKKSPIKARLARLGGLARRLRIPGLARFPWLQRALRPWPVYLGAVAAVGVTYYVVSHRQAGTADAVLPSTISLQQNIEIQFQDVTMQGRQHGVQRWAITAPKVALSKDGRYTYFEPDPQGEFFNLKDWTQPEGTANPRVRSMLWQADKAQFDSFTEDLTIDGHAVITTDNKDVLKTERVDYHQNDKTVSMPKPVDIQMKDGTHLKGDSLTANTDAEEFELKGKVDLVTNVNDQEKL